MVEIWNKKQNSALGMREEKDILSLHLCLYSVLSGATTGIFLFWYAPLVFEIPIFCLSPPSPLTGWLGRHFWLLFVDNMVPTVLALRKSDHQLGLLGIWPGHPPDASLGKPKACYRDLISWLAWERHRIFP